MMKPWEENIDEFITTANKKAGRNTQEGIIYSYIHTGNKL